jgi:hypothetical protein
MKPKEPREIAFNISQGLLRISDLEFMINNVSKWSSETVLFFDEYEKLRRIDKFNKIKERWKSYCQNQCITLLTKI